MATKENKKNEQIKKAGKTMEVKLVDLGVGESTIRVEVEDTYRHEKYGKLIRSVKTFLVQMPEEVKENYKVGDMLTVVNVKPISKLKHWKVVL